MKEKYMKDFNGEKIFSLEYDKETLKDMVLDKQEEIERLKKAFEDLEKYVIVEGSRLGLIGTEKVINKIKELEK